MVHGRLGDWADWLLAASNLVVLFGSHETAKGQLVASVGHCPFEGFLGGLGVPKNHPTLYSLYRIIYKYILNIINNNIRITCNLVFIYIYIIYNEYNIY